MLEIECSNFCGFLAGTERFNHANLLVLILDMVCDSRTRLKGKLRSASSGYPEDIEGRSAMLVRPSVRLGPLEIEVLLKVLVVLGSIH